MSNQHLMGPGALLDAEGNIAEAGYATSLVKSYDRNLITVSKMRIKEWDYYYVGNADYGLAVTVADNGYMSLSSVTVLEFGEKPHDTTKSIMGLLPFGKLNLPKDSRIGDIVYTAKGGVSIKFLHEGKKRRIVAEVPDFGDKGVWFRCDVILEETVGKSIVKATPFNKKGHFYYNQKINNLKASGYFKVAEREYSLNKDSYGVLDWGRGVWTYKNTWYWASCQGKFMGKTIGFNLGYGFGDNSAASENMLFVDKEAYKFGDVRFDIPMDEHGRDSFMEPWTIRSSSGDIKMTFKPIYNRHYDGNGLVIRSNQNQVFGLYTGYFLIDGEQVYLENLPGFAEKVYNRW